MDRVDRADGDEVLEGALTCPDPACRREHPVIDGIPVVVADLRSWTEHQFDAVVRRTDLTAATMTRLGDAAGPGTNFDDDRRTISTYAEAHFDGATGPGTFASLLDEVIGLAMASGARPEQAVSGPWVDIGCGPGRATFTLAARGASRAVGIDLSFGFLRLAEQARRTGRVTWPRRRTGVVFDVAEADDLVAPEVAAVTGFVCADAANLPLSDGAWAGALSINVIDCIADPVGHAVELGRLLRSDGVAVLASPYDWAATATPFERWIGGHSQRGPAAGSSEVELRRLFGVPPIEGLDTGLVIGAEIDAVPWRLRVHDRSSIDYACHVVRLDRRRHPDKAAVVS